MKRVLITTLGCKVNQFESAAFRTGFEEAGCLMVTTGEPADIVVVNTCAVTAKAGAQSRQTVRQALRNNPAARLLITGCYAEIGAKELASISELQGRSYTIIGNAKKDELVATALDEQQVLPQLLLGAITEAKEICRLPVRRFGDRTRAFLRVQDGCESFCTYCIVPHTRGPSRSLPLPEVLQQAMTFAAEGHREIVLTGIHLGNYGRDLGQDTDLTLLLDRLSLQTPDVRYRISSLEPLEITEQLLTLIKERDNLMPHLHIPLQSGDDTILARMNRRYTTSAFQQVIDLCRSYLPKAALGIDVLVGFPGESDLLYTHTREFLDGLDCTYLHVFPYSQRPGTVAAEFGDTVGKQEKNRRVAELRSLGEQKRDAFHRSQLNRIRPVLVEGQREKNGLLRGFTDNYIPVLFSGQDHLMNSIVNVLLTRTDGAQVRGEVIDDNEG